MTDFKTEKLIIFALRICLGWTFLYAASHQVFVAGWSVSGFLSHTTTFSWLFTPMAGPTIAPVLSFLVSYGHLLIGLSLISGMMVRVSSIFGILLMVLYWMAHMEWPYIGDQNSFIVDFHIIYALALWLLIVKRAGHVAGLDAMAARMPMFNGNGLLKWSVEA